MYLQIKLNWPLTPRLINKEDGQFIRSKSDTDVQLDRLSHQIITFRKSVSWKIRSEFNYSVMFFRLYWMSLKHSWPWFNTSYKARELQTEVRCLKSIDNTLNTWPHLRLINSIWLWMMKLSTFYLQKKESKTQHLHNKRSHRWCSIKKLFLKISQYS